MGQNQSTSLAKSSNKQISLYPRFPGGVQLQQIIIPLYRSSWVTVFKKLFKDYRPHLIKKSRAILLVAFLTDFNLLGYTKLVKIIITNNVIIKPNFLMVYCFLGCTKVPRSNVGNGLWKSEERGCCPPTEPAAKGGAWFRSEILDTNWGNK